MRLVIDIECNGLEKPDKIWLIVCKDLDTGKYHIFREVSDNASEAEAAKSLLLSADLLVGHNIIGYDCPVLNALLQINLNPDRWIDTLIISRLICYSRPKGHSIESYGEEFGQNKLKNSYPDFFKKWSQPLEDYCVRDVDISEQIYRLYAEQINDPAWHAAIDLEQRFQLVCNNLHDNGFALHSSRASSLLEKVTKELGELDANIASAFPTRTKLVREYTPKLTKYGTIARTSIPRGETDLTPYSEGSTFSRLQWVEFNPSSHKQVIEVLNNAGWSPTDKTKTHVEADREKKVDEKLLRYGWKINENNLGTLPTKAPEPARLLAKRILLESRRRTLTEWLSLVQEDGRIHGRFHGIGAWTHRMAHQQPNTANIPNDVYISTGKPKLLGKEMRQLWCAPRGRLLVGVDAEAIQLRIFAHMIDDKELTNAIVNGKKSDGTDPHSLNRRVFGDFCKTRNAAKHSLYAIFFGGRANKIKDIMACSKEEANLGIQRLLLRYPGLARLEKEVFPLDAKRGYFTGLDGRKVKIPDETISGRKHLCMSGYLQNGEAVCMKLATLKWWQKLEGYDAKLVNFVHDEWQVECPNNVDTALKIAEMMANSLREVGEDLKLKCPLAGSYWNDDHKDYTIGSNWYQTH